MDDLMVTRDGSQATMSDTDISHIERQIRHHLREIMIGLDLEELTSKMVMGRDTAPL